MKFYDLRPEVRQLARQQEVLGELLHRYAHPEMTMPDLDTLVRVQDGARKIRASVDAMKGHPIP